MGRKNPVQRFLNKKITRREFLKYTALAIGGTAAAIYGYQSFLSPKSSSSVFRNDAPAELWKWSKEASYYTSLGKEVRCQLCPNQCALQPNDRGVCRVRVNKEGKLYTLSYGNPASVHVDPIEKKPLFHFLPQTTAFSIATAGCNFRCLNCQNWSLSQSRPEDLRFYDMMPASVVETASQEGCASIAYTYSEPSVFYEYMHDTAELASSKGIRNVWVTNGYLNEKPLRELSIDAANVDLKSFRESIYNELNSGSLKPVLDTLKVLKDQKKWIEITNLVVPSWTDDLDMIREMSQWLAKNGFEDYPLHFSRFTPMYKLTHLSSTPLQTLEQAREIAMDEGIKFVFIGNVPNNKAESTYCPNCGKIVIGRRGYTITENNLQGGACRSCGESIPGVWS